jgi:putative RNA 2'-phosphotransferase
MPQTDHAIKKLSKFLEYVLGRRPDEFGLIPNAHGFVKIKFLLQALHEDPEWRHIRQGQLNTLLLLERPAPVEIEGPMIRACLRDQLPAISAPQMWPKLLYTPVRQRAYPVVLEKGLHPSGQPHVQLSSELALALRLGQRIDNHPVLLTVQVAQAQAAGIQFKQYGQALFLADFIPVGTFSGPPLAKEKPVAAEPKKPLQPKTPGSFFPDLAAADKHCTPPHQKPKRNEMDWKKERRQARREKQRRGFA